MDINLPIPVKEEEIAKFEDFVDDFSRKMDRILKGEEVDDNLLSDFERIGGVVTSTDAAPALAAEQVVDAVPDATPKPAETPAAKLRTVNDKGVIDYTQFEQLDPEAVAVEVKEPATKPAASATTSDDAPTATPNNDGAAETSRRAESALESGKAAVLAGDWPAARAAYESALAAVSTGSLAKRAHSNLALVFLHLHDARAAHTHACASLALDGTNLKSHWRRCQAARELAVQDAAQFGEWVAASAGLRLAIVAHPAPSVTLAAALETEVAGWQSLPAETTGMPADFPWKTEDMFRSPGVVGDASKALTGLGKSALGAAAWWLRKVALPHAAARFGACSVDAHVALMDLVQSVGAVPEAVATLDPLHLSAWLVQVWQAEGKDLEVVRRVPYVLALPYNFAGAVPADAWMDAATEHVRYVVEWRDVSSPALPVLLVEAIFASTRALRPKHAAWPLIHELLAQPWVDRDHAAAIATNLLHMRPYTGPASPETCARVQMDLIDGAGPEHLRLWSRLSRIDEFKPALTRALSRVVPATTLTSLDMWRAWSIAALDLPELDKTRYLRPAALAQAQGTVDLAADDVCIGNMALLVARAPNVSKVETMAFAQWLFPALQSRSAEVAKACPHAAAARENIAIAMAKLCTHNDAVREWLRECRGMELLHSVTVAATGRK
ncbi:hypothetical protein H9P43_001751 [Blastocladiella emersonii ATCC 22665]|nr:hypothetical protein H9P43_001751 [Blastocladiella emersonii ATCC 22665]